MYLLFAWRYFKAKKSANAINIIAWVTTCVIAFATCCQVLVLSVFNGFEGLVKSLYSSFYADLKIVPVNGKTFNLTPAQLTQINHQPYISNTSMIAEENALLQNDENQSLLRLKGVDENYKYVSGLPQKISRGKFLLGDSTNPSIIVGAGIQYASEIIINDAFAPQELTVILPKKNSTSNDPLQSLSEGNVTATGAFAIQQEFDNGYAITNIGFVKQQMGFAADEYSAVEIKLKPGAEAEQVDAGRQQMDDIATGLGAMIPVCLALEATVIGAPESLALQAASVAVAASSRARPVRTSRKRPPVAYQLTRIASRCVTIARAAGSKARSAASSDSPNSVSKVEETLANASSSRVRRINDRSGSRPCRSMSCRLRQELGDADQVVGGERQGERHADALESAEFGLPAAADRLQPAENLLDPLALVLAHGIARMPRRTAVDRRAAALVVLRHVRGGAEVAHISDEVGGVVGLVAADGGAHGRRDYTGSAAQRRPASHASMRASSFGRALPLAR